MGFVKSKNKWNTLLYENHRATVLNVISYTGKWLLSNNLVCCCVIGSLVVTRLAVSDMHLDLKLSLLLLSSRNIFSSASAVFHVCCYLANICILRRWADDDDVAPGCSAICLSTGANLTSWTINNRWQTGIRSAPLCYVTSSTGVNRKLQMYRMMLKM